MLTPLWQFFALLVVHWIADFVLQTHWQASNKSKRLDALFRHVGTYTAALAFGTLFIVPGSTIFTNYLGFVVINGALHLGTDYFTSRWSSRLFRVAFEQSQNVAHWDEIHGDGFSKGMFEDPAKHWHNFFVVIGFDQLIHQSTLAVTMWVILL